MREFYRFKTRWKLVPTIKTLSNKICNKDWKYCFKRIRSPTIINSSWIIKTAHELWTTYMELNITFKNKIFDRITWIIITAFINYELWIMNNELWTMNMNYYLYNIRYYFKNKICYNDDGSPDDVSQDENMDLLQTLVQRILPTVLRHGGETWPAPARLTGRYPWLRRSKAENRIPFILPLRLGEI